MLSIHFIKTQQRLCCPEAQELNTSHKQECSAIICVDPINSLSSHRDHADRTCCAVSYGGSMNLPDKIFVGLQSVAMLRNITTFHTLATAAVERTAGAAGGDQKITYNVIKNRLSDLLYKITSQKFEDPAEGEDTIK